MDLSQSSFQICIELTRRSTHRNNYRWISDAVYDNEFQWLLTLLMVYSDRSES